METGTSLDDTDDILIKQKEKKQKDVDAICISKILGFDIFPSLINLFCFSQNFDFEQKILSIMSRLYNQRQELADLSTNLLLLFDKENIQILKTCKQKYKKLGKNVDETETWMKSLNEPKNVNVLDETILLFNFFNDILFVGSVMKDEKNVENNESVMEIDPVR